MQLEKYSLGNARKFIGYAPTPLASNSRLYLLIVLWVLLALVVRPALAQPAPVNPQSQIEQTIGNLFITNTNLSAQLAQAQQQVSNLQKQLADEKAKSEPKKEDKP